jgi:hypothetical protein
VSSSYCDDQGQHHRDAGADAHQNSRKAGSTRICQTTTTSFGCQDSNHIVRHKYLVDRGLLNRLQHMACNEPNSRISCDQTTGAPTETSWVPIHRSRNLGLFFSSNRFPFRKRLETKQLPNKLAMCPDLEIELKAVFAFQYHTVFFSAVTRP